ncbi:MAG: hypothetical protein JWP25_7014 [Bradyrhizobium sp.]|nr:hypothetical protein [Bradyrhizobium sp.]
MSTLIDVWDTETFDQGLISELRASEQLVRDYLTTDRRQFEEREASDRWMPYASNPYASGYLAFLEAVGRDIMQARTIRAWHYTRLVDDEVRIIRTNGIYPGSLDTLQRRLDALVTLGSLTTSDAKALFAASPCHHKEQRPGRLGKFWMTSNPVLSDDSGVELLLGNWGGEATYFWLEDKRLEKLVAEIGQPRILEIAVPVANTNHWYSAGKAVVAAFARTLGCRPDRGAFDLYSMVALGPEAVRAIHTAGDANFSAMARGYPAGFSLGE